MKRRIVICLGLLLALCVLGNAIAMWSLGRSIVQLRALARSHQIQTMRADLASSGTRLESDLLGCLSGLPRSRKMHAESIQRFRRAINQCTTCHHEADIQAKLEVTTETFESYRIASKDLFSEGETTPPALMDCEAEELIALLVSQTTLLADQASRHLGVRSSDAAASVQKAWVVLIITVAGVLIVGGVVAFHLMRRLTEPVDALLLGIERVRQGDANHQITVDADPEFRTLASGFNEANKSLQHARDGVLQAEKMAAVGKLAAGVAHEVGNPLASISSIAQVMGRDSESGRQADHSRLILEEVNRISRVVRDLLTFSRPAAKREREAVQVCGLLDRATKLLSYDRRSRNIEITYRCADGLAPVVGDADKLLLVFTNIIINAYDALLCRKDNGAALTITAMQDAGSIVARFQDNGPGMTDEDISNAFEPFFTTKEPGAGTGLGLWICYQVVEEHKGTIRLESQPGEGTTVTVTLPGQPQEERECSEPACD